MKESYLRLYNLFVGVVLFVETPNTPLVFNLNKAFSWQRTAEFMTLLPWIQFSFRTTLCAVLILFIQCTQHIATFFASDIYCTYCRACMRKAWDFCIALLCSSASYDALLNGCCLRSYLLWTERFPNYRISYGFGLTLLPWTCRYNLLCFVDFELLDPECLA